MLVWPPRKSQDDQFRYAQGGGHGGRSGVGGRGNGGERRDDGDRSDQDDDPEAIQNRSDEYNALMVIDPQSRKRQLVGGGTDNNQVQSSGKNAQVASIVQNLENRDPTPISPSSVQEKKRSRTSTGGNVIDAKTLLSAGSQEEPARTL